MITKENGGSAVKYYIIAFFVLIFDQLTKWLVVSKMTIGEQITIINNFFYITSHRNRGAAFGILQGQMWLFFIVTFLVVAFVVYYIKKHATESMLLGLSLSLVLGGAIGNFIDRFFRGEVVDFLDFLIFNYDFAIFNIADMALVIGVGILMIQIFFEGKTREIN